MLEQNIPAPAEIRARVCCIRIFRSCPSGKGGEKLEKSSEGVRCAKFLRQMLAFGKFLNELHRELLLREWRHN